MNTFGTFPCRDNNLCFFSVSVFYRVGNQIDVSEKFIDSISDLTEESTTFAWVNIKSDSLYNAFSSGKKLLIAAAEFLSFMIKNELFVENELKEYLYPLFEEEKRKIIERELAEYERIKNKYNLKTIY